MRIRTQLATIAIVLGLVLSGGALASDMPTFEEVDRNNDGAISKTEAEAVPDLDFAAADSNEDGMLSRTEYNAALS